MIVKLGQGISIDFNLRHTIYYLVVIRKNGMINVNSTLMLAVFEDADIDADCGLAVSKRPRSGSKIEMCHTEYGKTNIQRTHKNALPTENKAQENGFSVRQDFVSNDFFSPSPAVPSDWSRRSKTASKTIYRLCKKKRRKNIDDLRKDFDDLCIENIAVWDVIVQKDSDGDNLLFIAIILLQTHLAQLLVSFAPSYEALYMVNKLRQTALHLAALTGNYIVARRLLVAGAMVDERDRHLNTPLHIAVEKGFIKVAKTLLTPVTYLETKQNWYEIPFQKIPQNLELYNVDGMTCLHIAGHKTDKSMIDLLLTNEADINAKELKSGKTLLHFFAENDNINMVKYLISKPRLNLDVTTYCGLTAADVAYSRGRFAVAYLLLSSGANETIPEAVGVCDSESDTE